MVRRFLGNTEMMFIRRDALGAIVEDLMGYLVINHGSGNLVRFKFTETRDTILEGLSGWGEYFDDPNGRFGSYVHLIGTHQERVLNFDAILYGLEMSDQKGLHLFGTYGVNIHPLTLETVPEPHDPHHQSADEIQVDPRLDLRFAIKWPIATKNATEDDGAQTLGGGGSTVVGSSWHHTKK